MAPVISFAGSRIKPTESPVASLDQFVRAADAGYQTGQKLGSNFSSAYEGFNKGRETAQRQTINEQTIDANYQLEQQRELQMQLTRIRLEDETRKQNDENLRKAEDQQRLNDYQAALNKSAELKRQSELNGMQSSIDNIRNGTATRQLPDGSTETIPKKDALGSQYAPYWAKNPQEFREYALSDDVWNTLSREEKKAASLRMTRSVGSGFASDKYKQAEFKAMQQGAVNGFYQGLSAKGGGLDYTTYLSGLTAVPRVTGTGGATSYDVYFNGEKYDVPWSEADWQSVLAARLTGVSTGDLDSRIINNIQTPPPAEETEVTPQPGFISRSITALGGTGAALREGLRASPVGSLINAAEAIGGLAGAGSAGTSGPAGLEESIVRQKLREVQAKAASKNLTPEQQQTVFGRLAADNIPTGVNPVPTPVAPPTPSPEPTATAIPTPVNPVSVVPQEIRNYAKPEAAKAVSDEPLLKDKPPLIKAIATVESGGKKNAKSPTGVEGLMQVEKNTAAMYGLNRNIPEENVRAGEMYINDLTRQFRSTPLALAAYNAGPGVITRAINIAGSREWSLVRRALGQLAESGETYKTRDGRDVPWMTPKKFKETSEYPDKVLANLYLFEPKPPTNV